MKNKGLKCSVEKCGKEAVSLGMCQRHYLRVRAGIQDMRPGRLPTKGNTGCKWRPDDPRYKNKNMPCKVDGCTKLYFAKGYCRNHYAVFLRRGYTDPIVKHRCSVEGCTGVAGRKGMCTFHLTRARNGIDLLRPRGVKGELNHNWKGGISEYPNHSEMRKVRRRILEKANWTCEYCGKEADRVHHKDFSKDNHAEDNLAASCAKCNANHRKSHTNIVSTSKFIRKYGRTAPQLATEFAMSVSTIRRLHSVGKLGALIQGAIPEEILTVLF